MVAPAIVAPAVGAAASSVGRHVVKYAVNKAKDYAVAKAIGGAKKIGGVLSAGLRGRAMRRGGGITKKPTNKRLVQTRIPAHASAFVNPERAKSIAYAGHAAMKLRK